jgi:hypothetical protein
MDSHLYFLINGEVFLEMRDLELLFKILTLAEVFLTIGKDSDDLFLFFYDGRLGQFSDLFVLLFLLRFFLFSTS